MQIRGGCGYLLILYLANYGCSCLFAEDYAAGDPAVMESFPRIWTAEEAAAMVAKAGEHPRVDEGSWLRRHVLYEASRPEY
jgi:hypothetical protein